MATRTMYLDEFDLDVDVAKTTARELKKMIAERVGLPPVAELFRLEGFQEPWELMCAQLVVGSLFLFRWFFTSFVRSFVRRGISCVFFLELTNSFSLSCDDKKVNTKAWNSKRINR